MTLTQLLDTVRDHYLQAFRRAIDEQADRIPPVQVLPEPILRTAEGEPAREGALDLPMRADLYVLAEGEDAEAEGIPADSRSMLVFDAVEAAGPKAMQIRVDPFAWDALDLDLGGLDPDDTDWSPLTGWFARWFDEADENPADEHGLSGVIHFLSDPIPTPEGTAFTIDLGSAPVTALEDLIDTVAGMGAASCRLVTECLDEGDVPDDEEDDDEADD